MSKKASVSEITRSVEVASQAESGQEIVRELEKQHKTISELVTKLQAKEPQNTVMTRYQEGFMTYFKVSLIFGLFFSLFLGRKPRESA